MPSSLCLQHWNVILFLFDEKVNKCMMFVTFESILLTRNENILAPGIFGSFVSLGEEDSAQ